jgi:DNA (cytosine-5)-methyltransferase 1
MGKIRMLPRGPRLPLGRRVTELFAGVGGFRLGLERAQADWQITWTNQWEPLTKRQHGFECYVHHFSDGDHSNEDISEVVRSHECCWDKFPDHDLLVGGFPCQDYSVARTLNQAEGLRGKKGVLWWEIYRILENKRPAMILLENVDRLLKSPAHQRGRDFAVILACLSKLGYLVEWRVVNAADYGYPQRRRRVFIVGIQHRESGDIDPTRWLARDGVLARSLPIKLEPSAQMIPGINAPNLRIGGDVAEVSETFGRGLKVTPFRAAGIIREGRVWTTDVFPLYSGHRLTLGEVLQCEDRVDERFFISEQQVNKWRYLKGAKNEPRVHRLSGIPYVYSEGAIPFPDPLDRPSRTILTGEGSNGPSRFKHVVATPSGRFRRLTPLELERLNGFDDGWTDLPGFSDARRAFLMGNALVVGIIERIGKALADPSYAALEESTFATRMSREQEAAG